MLHDFQAAFAQALRGANPAPPAALFATTPVPAPAGFMVYRRNIRAKAINALGDLYPTVARLVGNTFFSAAAAAYAEAHPPSGPVLIDYGREFAEFLDGLPGVALFPYLPDVARLELARHHAYHAREAAPLTPADFKAVPPERLAALRLTLHPSCRLVASVYPVDVIWEANRPENPMSEPITMPDRTAHIIVVRPHADVTMQALTAPGFRLLSALGGGATVGEAVEDAAFAPAMAEWIAAGVFGVAHF